MVNPFSIRYVSSPFPIIIMWLGVHHEVDFVDFPFLYPSMIHERRMFGILGVSFSFC